MLFYGCGKHEATTDGRQCPICPDVVRDGRDRMQNDGMTPPLMFHPKAFQMLWPMPQRLDLLIGRGVLQTESVPEHPNFRYQHQRTVDATI